MRTGNGQIIVTYPVPSDPFAALRALTQGVGPGTSLSDKIASAQSRRISQRSWCSKQGASRHS